MNDYLYDPHFFEEAFLQEPDSMVPQGDAWDASSLLPADYGWGDVGGFEAESSEGQAFVAGEESNKAPSAGPRVIEDGRINHG
ncbi:hypothetical protein SLS55_002629 [Diplodia seriata]|uniref:Uncharacterized protein n=1 Tax=Diplodia seriata TaxID=420778 RepID=A0ABR3CSQ4_9PEZI